MNTTPKCRWTYDTDTLTDTAWDTQCGHRHQFTSDGPVENEHKFCPYCGGELVTFGEEEDE